MDWKNRTRQRRGLRALRTHAHSRVMQLAGTRDSESVPSASSARAVAALFVHRLDRDTSAVAIPRAESQLVVRFGPSVRGGLDVHAVGARLRVHRKQLGAGHWSVTARLRLGAQEAVLGMPASKIVGRIVALEELWGDGATRRLLDQLAQARGPSEAALVLQDAISAHLRHARTDSVHSQLALAAAERLVSGSVRAVATDLGVSDRHLRRVFHEALGVSPKAFAKLARFRRALRTASDHTHVSWASIAAATGYYDQAHLIAEFRAIAGVTPRALLRELREMAPGLMR
jgi:AraC-like DNA-binding protein